MTTDYATHYLPNGIRLIFMPTPKFKTITMGLYIHQELNEKLAPLNALLSAVLEQGSRFYPDNLTLRRELENLYGADLSTDIIKSGERHMIACHLETVHGKYVGGNDKLLRSGMSILGSVMGDPLIEDNGFKKEYVDQEKDQLVKEIRSLVNDKGTYALEQCLRTMCSEERYGVYRLGCIENYDHINRESLYSYYRELLFNNPIDLYIIGELEEEQVLEAAREALAFKCSEKKLVLPAVEIDYPVQEVKSLEEEMVVNQAKLVLGFRTYTGFSDAEYCSLLVYSGVLGGFPHSKLFQQVREEAGLAYYIYSRLDGHKGLMVIAAGIDYSDYAKAIAIIDRQIEAMVAGKISTSEMENTKHALINLIRTQQDSPSQMIYSHLDGSIGGKTYTSLELIKGIEDVGLEEVKAVASRIKKDTIYLLRPRDGGSQPESQ
ncbi:MAG TPA: pitrilysin family protein [Candidatus Limnocylindrales bacterium]|nr:pitrilysin family protein [Candidatus Limnocylindrales bacterium]